MSEESKSAPEGQNPFDVFVEHQKKAMEEMGKALEALLPPGLKEHGQNALKEMAEGFRVLFNAMIDSIKDELDKVKTDEDAPPSSTGENKVRIEVKTE